MDLYQQFIAKSRYSRYLDDKNRREHFPETVDRYLEFFDQHLQKNFDHKMPREELREALLNFDVMPSMRAMMTAGKALERDHTANFNCAYLPVDDPKAFDEALHILSCGTGVGFSVEHKYVDKLPEIPEKMFSSDTVIVVKDSKEGWAKALRQLIALLYSGEMPKYDVSQVRPKGARLKTFGGRASGPEPLCELFDYVINKFKCAAGRKLSSIECHDIMCKIAEVIVVGGVRRCLPEGTRVHTPEGFKAIETLKPGDKVNTPYGPRKVLNVFDQGEQETIILKHAFGEFECTPNHKMAVFNSFTSWEFKAAKDLSPGDRLVMSPEEVVFTKKVSLPEVKYTKSPNDHVSTTVKTPVLDEKLAWFLGYFAGDGHVKLSERPHNKGTKGDISIAVGEGKDVYKEKLIDTFKYFGEINVRENKTKGKYSVLRVVSIHLAKWLYEYIKRPNTEIRIPDFIKTADPNIRWSYLSGVMDADGSCTQKQPTLCSTVYKKFAEDLKELYSSLGVLVYLKESTRKNPNWKNIYAVRTRGFHNYEKIEKNFKGKSLSYNHVSDKDVDGYSFPKNFIKSTSKLKTLTSCSKSVTARLVEEIKEEKLNLYPVNFISAEPKRRVKTWDIEVEGVHQFIAENLVTHNSALISLSDLEDDRMREAKSGSWWEHQGQRALANNSATYDRKPDMAQFLKEWTALFMSGSGERGLFSRYASKNIAAKSGRRSVSYEFGTNPCCFTGEMRLLTEEGYLPFSELVKRETVRIVNPNGAITEGKVWSSGIKPIIKVLLSTGKEISCTPDHVFRLANGAEKQAKDLVGETLDVYENFRFSAYRHGYIKGLSQEELSLIKELRLGGTLSGTSLIYQSLSETIIKDVSSVLNKLGIKSDHYKHGIVYELKVSDFDSLVNLGDKVGLIFTDTANKVAESLKEIAPSVVSVFEDGEQEVFDFTEPETHWGIVEGLVVHNSEIILRPNQFCNLTSIVARPGDTLDDLKRKARLATLLGTYQSTLTKFPYLRKMWKFNTEEERLLGVSLSGTCDHEILKDATEASAELLQKMREVVVETNRELAEQLGIPQSTATTCVKPEGTASQLNDTASGIHTRYAQYYIRRVRNDKKDPLSDFLMAKGVPHEDDLFNPSTVIFSFPRKSPEGSLLRNDKTAVEQLKYWKHIQENWCEHKPSITVYIKEDEWMEVGAWVWENFDVLSGVSFLPYDGGTYKQAPYEEIDEEAYNALLAEMPEEINWDDLVENEDNVEGVQNLACVAGICEI